MGTNFYLRNTPCPTCGRENDRIHLGKRSAGWPFLFRAYQNSEDYGVSGVHSIRDWAHMVSKQLGKGAGIYDEYGAPVLFEELCQSIEACNEFNTPEKRDAHNRGRTNFIDSDGNCLSYAEFS